MNVKEIRLKLTFGMIAGKWWGSENRRPIICLHGWQHNAGSFDSLIPLLPSEFSYFAIDLPGHGLSSHFPNGFFYSIQDWVAILEEIRLKFKWKRVSLIAHSMGAKLAFMYATLFPMHVDLVVALDILKPMNFLPAIIANFSLTKLRKFYQFNRNRTLPAYTYEEIKQRMCQGSFRSVNLDKVDVLMKRGIKRCPNVLNKFQLTRDPRINHLNGLFIQHEVVLEYIKEIQAAYLFIKTDDKTYDEPSKIFNESLEQFRRYNQRFEMMRVNGNHNVHLNNPTAIAPKISEFLIKFHIPDAEDIQSKL